MTDVLRAEVVGSMLRPDNLKAAHEKIQSGQAVDSYELKQLEDAAVNEAITIQERAGVDVVTDGEMRRMVFTAPIVEVVEGISHGDPDATPLMKWHGDPAVGDSDFRTGLSISGKLRRRRSLGAEEYSYARARTSKPIKATLPSPLMLSPFWTPEISGQVYGDAFDAFADGAEIVRQEAAELAELGCRYIQIDCPELVTHTLTEEQRRLWSARGVDPDRLLGEGVELINSVAVVPDVRFAIHMCRGNFAGRWMGEGGYDAVATQVFRRLPNFDAISLEYDDERSGGFAPLADIPDDKLVILGLVSTKRDQMESPEELERRIDEASEYHPRDQLALSTQCGFGSSALGNPITWATQEEKLRLVADVAHKVW